MKRIYLILLVVLMGAWTTQAQKNLPTTVWTGTASSIYGAGYVADNAIDGDTTSFWLTTKDLVGPHWIEFDMGKAYDIEGFRYTRRAGGKPGALKNGTIYDWTLQVSTDGTAWTTATAGTWAWDTWAEMDPKEELTGTLPNVRYVRLNSSTGMSDAASCAEFDVLVADATNIADFMADITKADLNQAVTFTDKSDNSPISHAWVFEGGTPAVSTDQNPVVTYAAEGTFDVTLTVTYADASTSTITGADFIEVKRVWKRVPKGAWTIAVDSYMQASQNGDMAIDDNPDTKWHTPWGANFVGNPHWMVVDMGREWDLEGFVYTPRSGAGNGTFKQWLFEVSADSVTWDILSGGEWTWDNDDPKEELTGTQPGYRYMRLTSMTSVGDFGSCVEFDALVDYIGADFSADITSVYVGNSVTFTDASDHSPTGWVWTFEGGTPASSTEQNPVVAYDTEGIYDVSLVVTHADASTTSMSKTDYIDVNKKIPSTNWEMLYYDSEELTGEGATNGRAAVAIDGDISTYWHTCWTCDPQPPYPHWFAVDMGEGYVVESFIYQSRVGGGNGSVDLADFYIVQTWPDRNDTTFWEASANWGAPVIADAVFDYATGDQFQVDLATPATGRYFVFYAKSERNDNVWANCGELFVIGEPEGATRIAKQDIGPDVMIYPNPNRGSFTVKVEEANATIKVYNATGTLVYQKKGASVTEQINISARGVYLIKIELNGTTKTKKLIIQ